MNKNPFLAVSQIVHQSFLDFFKTLDAAEPLPPIALKACPLAEELNLDENEALLLTLLIMRPQQSWTGGDLSKEADAYRPNKDWMGVMQGLRAKGYLLFEGSDKPQNERLNLPTNLLGYARFGQSSFLKAQRQQLRQRYFNACLDFFESELGIEEGNFSYFPGRDNQLTEHFVEWSEDPLVLRIHGLTQDLHEQMAISCLLGYEMVYRRPMPLETLLTKGPWSALTRWVCRTRWSQPDADLYGLGVVQAAHSVNGQVTHLRLRSEWLKSILPPTVLQTLSRPALPRTSMVQLLPWSLIQPVELHFDPQVEAALAQIREATDPGVLRRYWNSLRKAGMKAGLTVMLTGAPGTGKTEWVRQLARQQRRDILMVRVDRLRDKYFGETEKNLTRLFDEIQAYLGQGQGGGVGAGAGSGRGSGRGTGWRAPIVLFNEADAFFQKRMQANDSVDNTENILVTGFLERLETFEGLCFATTNYTGGMDAAIERRWNFKVRLSLPNVDTRVRLLQKRLSKSHFPFSPSLSETQIHDLAASLAFTPAQLDNAFRHLLLQIAKQRPGKGQVPDSPAVPNIDLPGAGNETLLVFLRQALQSEIKGWHPKPNAVGFSMD